MFRWLRPDSTWSFGLGLGFPSLNPRPLSAFRKNELGGHSTDATGERPGFQVPANQWLGTASGFPWGGPVRLWVALFLCLPSQVRGSHALFLLTAEC